MTQVNAFNWKEYSQQERERTGAKESLAQELNRSAKMRTNTTKAIDKIRDERPTFGTMFGISDKAVSTKPPARMKKAVAC